MLAALTSQRPTIQPQQPTPLAARFANWGWVFTGITGARNMGVGGVATGFQGGSGARTSGPNGAGYSLVGQIANGGLALAAIAPVSPQACCGVIAFDRTLAPAKALALFAAGSGTSGFYIQLTTAGAVEVDSQGVAALLTTTNVCGPGGNVMVWSFDGSRLTVALNGVLTVATGISRTFGWTTPRFGGASTSTYSNTYSQQLSALNINATLSDQEVTSLSLNPWQMFVAQPRRTALLAPGGPVPITGTIAVTLGPIALAIAASDPDASSVAVTLGAITTAIAVTSSLSAAIAEQLGSLVVTLTATDTDTDSSSIAVTLGAIATVVTASSTVAGAVGLQLATLGVDIEVNDPDASSIAVTLGSLIVDIESNAGGSAAEIAVQLGPLVVALIASDPDSSSIAVGLDSIAVALSAASTVAGALALTLGSIAVDIEAYQPGSTSIAVTLGAIRVDAELSSTVAGAVALQLATLGVDIEANDPDSSSFPLVLGSLVVDIEATVTESGDSAVIALQLGPLGVDIEVTVSGGLELPTLSEIIPAILNGLVGGRVWQDATPDDLPRDAHGQFLPFIIWTTPGGQDSEYVDQTLPDHAHARVQLTTLAPGAIVVDRLAQLVRLALLGSAYTVGVLGSPVGTYDAARKLRGKRQLISIWFRQSQS